MCLSSGGYYFLVWLTLLKSIFKEWGLDYTPKYRVKGGKVGIRTASVSVCVCTNLHPGLVVHYIEVV